MNSPWTEEDFQKVTEGVSLSDRERRILRIDMKLSTETEWSIERNAVLRKRLRLEAWYKIRKK